MATKTSKSIQWIPDDFVFGSFGKRKLRSGKSTIIRRENFSFNDSYIKSDKSPITPPWMHILQGNPYKLVSSNVSFQDYADNKAKCDTLPSISKKKTTRKVLGVNKSCTKQKVFIKYQSNDLNV
ncbi:hypothetical protein SteCoe_18722 [Stentor coeruleus]|uniref:Uncharacterized protein n=1 Tax=Stentor coeruleus TaxID=5963 RepID=A0A1R2BVR9_9CILI|nr:hypothetical protein SteCoe_18722 [Stentor coeruleus]